MSPANFSSRCVTHPFQFNFLYFSKILQLQSVLHLLLNLNNTDIHNLLFFALRKRSLYHEGQKVFINHSFYLDLALEHMCLIQLRTTLILQTEHS